MLACESFEGFEVRGFENVDAGLSAALRCRTTSEAQVPHVCPRFLRGNMGRMRLRPETFVCKYCSRPLEMRLRLPYGSTERIADHVWQAAEIRTCFHGRKPPDARSHAGRFGIIRRRCASLRMTGIWGGGRKAECLGGGCGNLPAQTRNGSTHLRVNGICQQDDVRVRGRIDPEAGTCEAGVPEAARLESGRDREDGPARAGERRVQVPPESVRCDAFGGLAILREDGGRVDRSPGFFRAGCQLEGRLRQWEGPRVLRQLIEQRLGKGDHVGCGGEDAGVAGDSAHAPRCRVMDGAAQDVVEVRIVLS